MPSNPSSADAQRARRLYYGWIIVAVISMIGMVQAGQFNTTVGVFVKPVTEEFDWSRSTFIGAISIGTLTGGALAPLSGVLLDRLGGRWVISLGLLLLGGSLILLSFVNGAWQFYVAMIVGRAGLQGATNLSLGVVVSKWFVRKRGRAMALAEVGQRAGSGLVPVFAQAIVSTAGWRTAAWSTGALVWVLGLLPALFFLRRQPEDLGLRPDGDEEPGPIAALTPAAAARGYEPPGVTLREALRSPVFWLITLAIAAMFAAISGISLNLLPYLSDQGLSDGAAVSVLAVYAAVSGFSAVGAGLLSERVAVTRLLQTTYVVLAASTLFLTLVDTTVLGIVFGVAAGIAFGTISTAFQLVLPAFFGRTHLGAIRGFSQTLNMGAVATGPFLMAFVFDATGSYDPILFAFAGLLAAGFVMLALVPKPRRAAPMR